MHTAHRHSNRLGIPAQAQHRPWRPERRELHRCGGVDCDAERQQANVLIDSKYRARLADFGLAVIVDESTAGSTINNSEMRGTRRWMAPEIIRPEEFGFTKECKIRLPWRGSDIYALGMVVLEVRILWSLSSLLDNRGAVLQVITGCHPFNDITSEWSVLFNVVQGGRPDRPPSVFTDSLWELLEETWLVERGSQSPKRPQASAVLDRLGREADNWGKLITPPDVVESTRKADYSVEDDGELFLLDGIGRFGADIRV